MKRGGRAAARGGAANGRAKDIEDALCARYVETQYAQTQYLSEHLAECSRAFAGDLQEALVLAIVGQVMLESVKAGSRPDARNTVTASRIADVTGIPRQTVRRKLLGLQAKNWIEQVDDHAWRIVINGGTSVAREHLAELDRRAISRLARLYASLEQLLGNRPDVSGPSAES